MKQKVKITRTEVYERVVEVDAYTREDAELIAAKNYEANDYFAMFDAPDTVNTTFEGENGNGGGETITQNDIDEMGERLDDMRDTLRKARRMAFNLAKKGDTRMVQLRGALSGLEVAAEDTVNFLAGLGEMLFSDAK